MQLNITIRRPSPSATIPSQLQFILAASSFFLSLHYYLCLIVWHFLFICDCGDGGWWWAFKWISIGKYYEKPSHTAYSNTTTAKMRPFSTSFAKWNNIYNAIRISNGHGQDMRPAYTDEKNQKYRHIFLRKYARIVLHVSLKLITMWIIE